MALTDVKVKTAKPLHRPYKMFDGGGLYLDVTPRGSKRWRLKYRFQGKENLLSLGIYPAVSLKDARAQRDEMKRLLAQGIDPSHHRKVTKAATVEQAANSFEAVGREWYAKHSHTWVKSHGERILRRLERDIFPWIGSRPVATITPPEILACLRRIESRDAIETAHRALQNCGQIMRYAVATTRAKSDPCRDLRGALPPPTVVHRAAITDPKKVPKLLRALDGYKGGFVVKSALRLAPLVFVRPGELRRARWADINLKTGEWTFTASKTKTPLVVPLSKQAIAILRELQPYTGVSEFVFPGSRNLSRHMSENAVLAALRSLGIEKEEHSGHGFRALARTILDEELGFPIHIIEQQLAHAVKDANGRAYNRTAHLPQRKKMMQKWADYLDTLKAGEKL